ncbi:unnamed protein product [Phytomonas sp. Hart1]|nr:unnamed protein product [Phytomonas sp. Hart1]|eukprot:CCW71105.1 unnamed protein product [Phytomonas sp. isolate Hart1]
MPPKRKPPPSQGRSPGSVTVADAGRFFYLNGILCKSFAADGAFRPSAVFPAVDAVAHTLATPTGEEEGDPIPLSLRPNLDDPILNTFGVLSKGVLMDPWDGHFVDFADPQVWAPSLLDAAGETSSREAKGTGGDLPPKQFPLQKPSARIPRLQRLSLHASSTSSLSLETLHRQNQDFYEQGDFSGLRAQACVLLCSSLEPLDRSEALEEWKEMILKDRTPFSWPYCRKFISHSNLHNAVKGYVEWLFTACEFPRAAVDPQSDRHHLFLHYLTLMEEYRLLIKLRRPQSTHLPVGIPFPFQYKGRALRRAVQNEESEINDASHSGEIPNEGDSSLVSASLLSSFSCLTGKPSMSRVGYSTIRGDIFHRYNNRNVVLEIQKYVTPLRALDCKRSRKILDEIERPYLYPPKHLSQWRRAWWIFSVYFCYLGLIKGPSSPQLKASASTELHRPIKSETLPFPRYQLFFNKKYSVSDEVHRKCLDEEKLKCAQWKGPSKLCAMRSPSKIEIAWAWNYMICHEDRDRLLERLSKVEMYLVKLTSSTNKRNKPELDLA